MKILSLIFLTICPFAGHSLLPPLYESLAEFKMLINDERLPKALESGEAIIEIKKNESIFTVITNKRSIEVKIVNDPTKLIGPGKRHLEFPSTP